MTAELDNEAEAVDRMIDRAIQEELTGDWVRNTITLIRFLRTPDATKQCLGIVQYCRKFSVATIFAPITEPIEEQ